MKKHSEENSEKQNDTRPEDIDDPLQGVVDKCVIMPITPMTETLGDGYEYGARINRAQGDFQIRKTTRFEKTGRNSGQLIKKEHGNLSIIGVERLDLIAGDNRTNIRLTNRALSELNRVVRNGKLIKQFITLSPKTLVADGLFNSERAARRGIYAVVDALSNIKIRGTLYAGGEDPIELRNFAVPFIGLKEEISENGKKRVDTGGRKNAVVTGEIALYPHEMEWGLLTQFAMPIPSYYYKLTKNAASLFFYIFAQARKNIRRLKRKKFIKIYFSSIRDRLALPLPHETKHPGRDIRGAIDLALEEIEEMHRKHFEDGSLELLCMHETKGCNVDECSINEYLERCFLRVKIKGDLLKYIMRVGGVKTHRRKKPPISADGQEVVNQDQNQKEDTK